MNDDTIRADQLCIWVMADYPALTRPEVNSHFLWPVWSVHPRQWHV